MKFGDIVRWKLDDDIFSGGLYMVIANLPISWGSRDGVHVVCLQPPKPSDWHIGEDAPCDVKEMELVQ